MKSILIRDLLAQGHPPLLSFEFFPPKDEAGLEGLKQAAEKLIAMTPDFVTVTYGAGGSTRERTFQACRLLNDMGFQVIMPHLTCVGASQTELQFLINHMYAEGYRNIMALRGDPPQGETVFQPPPDGLAHASDLVALIKRMHPDISMGVAGYPELHPEASSLDVDVRNIKTKVDAGADFITTQLFFDNQVYFDYVRRCRAAGISVPVLPGLLPAISAQQARRMTSKCKTLLPRDLELKMEEAGGSGPAAEEIGIRWAVRQVKELLAQGAPGIHLYVLNRAKAALDTELVNCIKQVRP